MNFFEFIKKFPTEKAIINHFIKIRYSKEKPICNHCNSCNVYHYNDEKLQKFFRCADCNRDFSIFKNTIFEKSCTDLRKWFYAIHLFLNGKKGISALQLQREVGVTYKTAWRMLRQIRIAMGNINDTMFSKTIVQMDETYIGTDYKRGNKVNKNNNDNDRNGGLKTGRGTDKIPVVALHSNNTIKAFVVDNTKSYNMIEIAMNNIEEGSEIHTDEYKSYKLFKTFYTHKSVNHSKEYVNSDKVHINNLENFFGTMKRGIYGIYHHISKKYLQNYVNEYCFRYNNRKDINVFDLLLRQCVVIQ